MLPSTLSEQDIRDALRACFDPGNPFGKPINIVDLGCIEQINLTLDTEAPGAGIVGVADRYRLDLVLLPTSLDPDARAQLSAQVVNRLAGLEQLSGTSVQLLDDPAWSESRLSPVARRELKLDPLPFRILNNRR